MLAPARSSGRRGASRQPLSKQGFLPVPSHFPSDALVVASRQIHDAFFRGICSDPARVDALIRAHWPPALRWLLPGEAARPADCVLVLGNLGQRRADGVFLVGGEGRGARAATILEGKSTVDFRTPGQSGGYLGAVQAQLVGTGCELVLMIAFHTGPDAWNVPGVIREAGCSLRDILCQMTWRNTYFQRQTRDIPYHDLAPDNSVLRAMLGMMGLSGLEPYPLDALRRMWREDLAGLPPGCLEIEWVLSYAFATSGMMAEEVHALALEAGLNVEEVDMNLNLIRQPQIIEAVEEAWADGEAKGLAAGEAKGKAEGRAEGMSEGMSEGLLRLFRRRFGEIPEGVEVKVRSAPLPDLEAWMDAFPDARKLDEVFRNGRAR